MGNAIQEAVLQACRNFMIPIARFLLRNGITYKQFAEIAKWAFVRVATEEYGVRGRSASITRVSDLTGLTRREVSRLRSVDAPSNHFEADWRIASDVLRAWHTRDAMLDSAGNPAALPFEGPTSFSALVRGITPNRSPAHLLELLADAGAVERMVGGTLRPVTRYYMPPESDARSVHHFGEALGNLAATIDNNYNKRRLTTRFERFVWSDCLPKAAAPRFQRILADHASKMLELLDEWLSAHEDPSLGHADKVGVGIYFFDSRDAPATNGASA